MTERTWQATKRLVYDRAHGCCEYCHTCEYNTGQSMHVEHINPAAGDDLNNLCLSCPSCNFSKGRATQANDPVTNQVVFLYNPRNQRWQDHFIWVEGGLRVEGLTPQGRATINRLKMNQPRLIRARQNWIRAKNHPPQTQ